MAEENMSLNNLKDGAIIEMFDHAMEEVLKNISDPNTEPKAKREINLKVVFQATDDRAIVGITASCNPKLTGQRELITTALVKNGQMIENKPRQMDLFVNNVTQLKGGSI